MFSTMFERRMMLLTWVFRCISKFVPVINTITFWHDQWERRKKRARECMFSHTLTDVAILIWFSSSPKYYTFWIVLNEVSSIIVRIGYRIMTGISANFLQWAMLSNPCAFDAVVVHYISVVISGSSAFTHMFFLFSSFRSIETYCTCGFEYSLIFRLIYIYRKNANRQNRCMHKRIRIRKIVDARVDCMALPVCSCMSVWQHVFHSEC